MNFTLIVIFYYYCLSVLHLWSLLLQSCKQSKKIQKNCVYEILDRLEQQPEVMKPFWRCIFQNHMLQLYPALQALRGSLSDELRLRYEDSGQTTTGYEMETFIPTDADEHKNPGTQDVCTGGRPALTFPGSSMFYQTPPVSNDERNTTHEQPEETIAKKRKKNEEKEDEQPGPSFLARSTQEATQYPVGLPVTCGDKEGLLNREKLQTGGKCIMSQGRWFTPTEFEEFGGKSKCKNWKTSIRQNGTVLQDLLKNGDLKAQRLKKRTSTTGQLQTDSNKQCFICKACGNLVCCDQCKKYFHQDCHLPPPTMKDTKWLCTFCVLEKTRAWRYNNKITEQQALDSHISQYMLQCHALLLKLLSADKQGMFTSEPKHNAKCYSELVQRPMWLKRVKRKSHDYKFVREFVSDVRLIFKNAALHKNTEFTNMGVELGNMFEDEFRRSFNIQ
uniref:Nuclear body protein SP140-like protein n=1 Tax=Denticeps clupeoides TaxID=299321 RepID=A0AAY4APA3_9TELE